MKQMPVAIGVDRRELWESFVYSVAMIGLNHWVGSAIFIWGSIHQLRCHAILVSHTIIRITLMSLNTCS